MQYKIEDLINKSKESIIEIFSNIPEGTISLDLSGNDFGHFEEMTLREIFSIIPKSIINLNLRNNYLGVGGEENWDGWIKCIDILGALRKSNVIYIDLSGNDLHLLPITELIGAITYDPKFDFNFGS